MNAIRFYAKITCEIRSQTLWCNTREVFANKMSESEKNITNNLSHDDVALLKVFHAKVIAMCETTSFTWVTILLKLVNQK